MSDNEDAVKNGKEIVYENILAVYLSDVEVVEAIENIRVQGIVGMIGMTGMIAHHIDAEKMGNLPVVVVLVAEKTAEDIVDANISAVYVVYVEVDEVIQHIHVQVVGIIVLMVIEKMIVLVVDEIVVVEMGEVKVQLDEAGVIVHRDDAGQIENMLA